MSSQRGPVPASASTSPAVFQIRFADDVSRPAVRIESQADLPAGLDALGVPRPRPVLVLVGGAGKLGESDAGAAAAVIDDAMLPIAAERGAVIVDGGTDSGIMRIAGRGRAARELAVPLVGVAAIGTVAFPGNTPAFDDAAQLQPDHTAFVLVPGTEWGAESPWLPKVAAAIASGSRVVTVLVNGGKVSAEDVRRSLAAGFPVVVAAGTGRLADEIAAAAATSPDYGDLKASPLVHVTGAASGSDPAAVIRQLLQ